MTIAPKPALLVATVLFLASCGEGSDEDASALRIDRQCTLTSCQARQRTCAATTTSQCDSCWDAVSGLISSGGGFYDCSSVCDSSRCYRTCPENDTCEAYSFSVTLPQQRDEALYQACLEAEARDKRCKVLAAPWSCDAFARVERAEATRVYKCHAQAPCNKSPARCNDLPQLGVGKRYCAGFQKICGAKPKDCASPDKLDTDLFNWLRDQVNSELLGCLDLGCYQAQKCLEAYFAALK